MVRPGTPPDSLLSALADGQAVLCLGPGFAHGLTAVDWVAAFEALRAQVSDASGWDALTPADRVQLYVETHGRERLEVELAGLLPSVEVLRAQVTDFHKALLGLPCPVVVTTTWDGLVEATLDALDVPYHVVADDDDVDGVRTLRDGARLVIKMHGDPLAHEPVVITREDHRAYAERRPQTLSLLRGLIAERTLLLYGHAYDEPGFMRLCDELRPAEALVRPVFSVMKEPNALLAQGWARRRVEVITGNTWSELERWMEGLRREAERRHRLRTHLDTLLTETFPDDKAVVETVRSEVQGTVIRRLGALEAFRWLRGASGAAEAPADPDGRLTASFRVLRALAAEGVCVPPEVFGEAAERLLQAGHTDDARSAVDLALCGSRIGGRVTPTALRSRIGRVLCRLGELERARPLLEHAVMEGPPADEAGRASELAWLCRAVLERVEDLRERQRERAARELLGRFMVTFAPHFRLAERSAEAGGGLPTAAEDDAWRWSLYYVNFRLGRLFALASEMAGMSGAVYSQQAVERLARAVEISPAKPEPYRVLRPLLLAPRGHRPDKARWERIVVQAPVGVRRALEELDAQDARVRGRTGR